LQLQPGTRLGPYEILSALGAGGMGEVYRAHDSRLGRDVAIKVLPAAFGNDPARLARLEQEARALSALNHPNILAIYDIGEKRGLPFLVTELVEGKTLREALEPAGTRLSVRRAVDCGLQVAQALAAAHARGVLHRDLKPDNIVISADWRPKVLRLPPTIATDRLPGDQHARYPSSTPVSRFDEASLSARSHMPPLKA
jgi:eukaryotic-like serine/threonine-protein kinase